MNTQELINLIDKIGMMKGPYFRDLELSPDDIVTGVDELQKFAAAVGAHYRKAALQEAIDICINTFTSAVEADKFIVEIEKRMGA